MKISVFGLGYVGAVTAACLADEGHEVIGVDIKQEKIDTLNAGRSPIMETGLEALIAKAVKVGRLRATREAADAIQNSDLSLVCVGTPSQSNGALDISHLQRTCHDIAQQLLTKVTPHTVVIRSTVLPGTTRASLLPIFKATEPVGGLLSIAYHPEFLREGSAVEDYRQAHKIVVGADTKKTAKTVLQLYPDSMPATRISVTVEEAELLKYIDNSWHALKVAYANEIGTLCHHLGLDSQQVMHWFKQDEKLNISPAYLTPGLAFGGSCLPKDVRALTYATRQADLTTPLLNAIIPSNRAHIDRAAKMILERGRLRIGILGVAFKDGTDDVRESPMIKVVERLLAKGKEVRIYDPTVKLSQLVGANREYLLNTIPHINNLLVDTIDDIGDWAEVVVLGLKNKKFEALCESLTPQQDLIDFVRLFKKRSNEEEAYYGLCW